MYDIHSPHTRGDRRGERWRLRRGISIHSCEGRQQQNAEGAVEQEFQSAPLMRGETVGDVEHAHRVAISIHSPHARGDTLTRVTDPQSANFNPLPSCEGRHRRTRLSFSSSTFQSTPLMRGETRGKRRFHHCNRISIRSPHARGDLLRLDADVAVGISIHSPHARGDLRKAVLTMLQRHFNPLPSHEGRRNQMQQGFCAIQFQSTPLTRGETLVTMACVRSLAISIHSPHTRGDKQVLL